MTYPNRTQAQGASHSFLEFLEKLSNNEIDENFTLNLINNPSKDNNFYFSIGERWCSVSDLLKCNSHARDLFRQYACEQIDPDFSFSTGNLKAQYIPDEDFINDGSAIILYSLVGSTWSHTVHVNNQLKDWLEK